MRFVVRGWGASSVGDALTTTTKNQVQSIFS
jgi:hypothetical protein